MIPIILQKNTFLEAAKPLDAKYFNIANTPYVDTAEVLAEIPVGYRHTGLTVLVVDKEYWFDSVGDLVLKDNDTGLMDYRGAYDASSNTYPTTGGSGDAGAIMKADVFVISVAGTLGGVAIQVGDYLIANTDTPAQTSSKWDTLNTNISYVPEDIANKVTSISGASTNVQYPSAKLVFDQLALKEDLTNKVTSISGSSTNTQYPTAKLLYDKLALKQANISLTTTGSSGASTFVSNTLNVPTYTLSGLGGVSSARQLTINGTTYDLSANRTWSVGTVTGVTATSPVFSSGGAAPNITIQQASASLSGYLSSTDWTTFNSKQNAISPAALTKTNDTNVTLTLGGSPTTALLAETSLTLGWTGTLADSRIASATTWNAKQNALGFTPENVANKVTSVSSASTDNQYPTAKLLFDSLGGGGVGGYVYWSLGNEPVGGGSENVPLYGMLYNWYAATDARNIANSGWHVPDNVEMNNLRIFLDPTGTSGSNTAGGAMKATGTTYWSTPNTGATNSSNLNVKGAGQRSTASGGFGGFNTNTQFWNTWSASTEDGGTGLLFHDNETFFTGLDISTNKYGGLSIILRKDTPTVGANYTIVPNGYTGNDGNVYNTVIIDGYEWTGALLIETKYRNGDSIPNVTDDTAWVALTSGALCYYNNDVANAYTTGGTSSLNVYNHNLVKFKDNASVTWTKTQIDSNTIDLEATISATGTVTSVTGTSPISSTGGATPAISISQANTTTSGYISSTDWNTFNGKQAALSGTGFVKSTSGTISYDTSSYYLASNPSGYTSNTGTVTSVGVSMPSAFSVASSPVTTSGTIAITGAGDTTQYVDGTGALQSFPAFASADKMITIGRNATGSTLYKGTIIYISGSTGNRPNFVKAQANAESTSAGTFGVVLADIANNDDGNVVNLGTIETLDTRSVATNPFTTDTLVDGDTIYLSPTTAGYVTRVKPVAPNHMVYVGKVVRTSPTNGTIVYRIQNGYELEELHNVDAQSPNNNDGLFYNTTTSLWEHKSTATALGYTPENAANKVTSISGTSTDVQFPSAKLVYDQLALKQNTITAAALTKTDDTNVTLTLGGSPTTSLLAATSLTLGWTGTLADSRIASASTWNGKQAALSGTGFVKSTAGTISYDTNTYLTSLSGAVLTDQTTGQTIGATATRLTKLWATDITVTNAINGSVTGNAGTVTNGVYTTGAGTVYLAPTGSAAGLTSFPTLNQNTTGTANIANGTLGAIPYQSAANTTTVLAANATANKMLLSGASAAPTWSTSTIPTSAGTSGNVLASDGTNYVSSDGANYATYARQGTEFKGDLTITSNAIDWSTGFYKAITLAANTTFTFTNLEKGKTIVLKMTGSFTPTFPASVVVLNGGTYTGASQNYILLTCVDSATPLVFMTINK